MVDITVVEGKNLEVLVVLNSCTKVLNTLRAKVIMIKLEGNDWWTG